LADDEDRQGAGAGPEPDAAAEAGTEHAEGGRGDAPVDEAEGTAAEAPEEPAAARPRRPARFRRWGTATASYVAVVLAVLVAVNLVGSKITTSWDVTSTHALTLSTASKNIVKQLKQKVQIIAFLQPGDLQGQKIRELLSQYVAAAHGMISAQVVDPVADRALAIRYNVTSYGTVVVASGSNVQQVQESSMITYSSSGAAVFNGEGPLTNAIIQVAAPGTYVVDWLVGDGEPDIVNGSLPNALTALQDQGYKVQDLNLLSSGAAGIPASVSCVVIADPVTDLSPAEISALKKYASGGGHILFLLDPTTKPLPNLDKLLSGWGVTLQNNLVVDSTQHYGTDPTAIVPTLTQSPITAPLQTAHLGVMLIAAQGLTLAKSLPGYTITPFLTSSATTGSTPTSWGVGNLASLTANSSLNYNAAQDIKGPLTLAAMVLKNTAGSASAAAAAASASAASGASGITPEPQAASLGQKQFRAVVFGDAQFISSAALGQLVPITIQGNKDLFLNSIGWLTGRQEGISVRPNTALNTQVVLTAAQQRALEDTFLLGIPLVSFALAFSTWFSRRRL
jgi:ABC-type uncharacterized transport system involved in gliding motility auxiliary subunit